MTYSQANNPYPTPEDLRWQGDCTRFASRVDVFARAITKLHPSVSVDCEVDGRVHVYLTVSANLSEIDEELEAVARSIVAMLDKRDALLMKRKAVA